jgi:hypothetical protein
MNDPNVTFKRDWAALVEKLGRQPKVTDPEWVKLHEDYKNAFSSRPAEETLLAPKARETKCVVPECVPGIREQTSNTNVVNVEKSSSATDVGNPGPMTTTTRETNSKLVGSAAGPVDMGFSRKPAPQARTYTYTRESAAEVAARARAIAAYVAGEPLSGPDKSNPREGAGITVSASVAAPGGAHGLLLGARGPGGGLVYRCGACGRLWERKVGRGRPANKCEECR